MVRGKKGTGNGETGGEPAAGCGCDCVAEEGWAGVSDARQPDAAGTDAEGFRGAIGFGRGGVRSPP